MRVLCDIHDKKTVTNCFLYRIKLNYFMTTFKHKKRLYNTYTFSDYLKLKMCPYPGLVEDLEFGIEDEIYCNVTVKVTVKAAVSDFCTHI